MSKNRFRVLLFGRHTVDFLHQKHEERGQYPIEKLEGESRWEALDSDTPASGPYAMRDENAADRLTDATYWQALSDLSRSCDEQPVGLDHHEGR